MKWRQVVRRKDVNLFCSQLLSFSNFFRENIRLIEYIGLWGWVHWHLVPMKFVGWPFMLTMPAWQPLSTPNYYLIFQTGHVSLALASFTERVCVFIYLFIYLFTNTSPLFWLFHSVHCIVLAWASGTDTDFTFYTGARLAGLLQQKKLFFVFI